MTEQRCLYCYGDLAESERDFHAGCSRKIFGKPIPPLLEYTSAQMLELAEKVIQSQSVVTGIQPKLSLGLKNSAERGAPAKLTIMGLWGDYILKPPSARYPHLPELEDLTMHLAAIAGIPTVPHTLIRLGSGELSYLTRRIDRRGRKKLHMEDMCQLCERLTEHKYQGSHEQMGRVVARHSQNPGLDLLNYFEQVVFCFLTGNNDMHLKNFSLLKNPGRGYTLSPAYDMVAVQLALPEDDEELALTLNGRKRKLTRKDFESAMAHFEIDHKALENLFRRLRQALPKWHAFIEMSFLPSEMREAFHAMLKKKAAQLKLGQE